MDEAVFGTDAVGRLARRLLGSDDLTAERHPVGFGNENWKLHDASGRRYVLKVGDRANQAKWRSSQVAYELAASAGVPVPTLVHVGEVDDHVVRIFTWIDGDSATQVSAGSQRSARLLRSLGEAVRSLHTITFDSFSSRLDGSAPGFATWKRYIDHRLDQIRARCEATHAVADDVLDRVCDVASGLADEVTDTAEAVLCHRDLHPDNLIVDGEGTLIGIVDWDAAEAWDRAGDWFKLEFDLLRAHPDGEDILLAAYLDERALPEKWEQRRRLVHLIESLNLLPNAATQAWDTDYADRARDHIFELLAGDRG